MDRRSYGILPHRFPSRKFLISVLLIATVFAATQTPSAIGDAKTTVVTVTDTLTDTVTETVPATTSSVVQTSTTSTVSTASTASTSTTRTSTGSTMSSQISGTYSTSWQGQFTGYFISANLGSSDANIHSIQGSVSISNTAANTFYEVLLAFGGDSNCDNGVQTSVAWNEVWYTNIVKGNTQASPSMTVPINFVAAYPIPIQGCATAELNFGDWQGGVTTVSSSLTITYDTNPRLSTPVTVNGGTTGEFCFNMSSGCNAYTPLEGQTFILTTTSYVAGYTAVQLFGSISAGVITPSSNNAWTALNSFYLDPSCGYASGITGPLSSFTVPSSWVLLYQTTLQGGAGFTFENEPVSITLNVPSTGTAPCYHWVSSVQGTAQLDVESQVHVLMIGTIKVRNT